MDAAPWSDDATLQAMELWNQGAKSRLMSRAYDFVLLIFAPWFLLAAVPWVPLTVFLLANLCGLFIFNNRFVRRDLSLTRRWELVLMICGLSLLVAWPQLLPLGWERKTAAILGAVLLVAVRLCFQPAEAAVRDRRQSPTIQ